jgi:hypothetical protein
MAEATIAREAAEHIAPDNAPEERAEEMRLYLPSQLPTAIPCLPQLQEIEWQLHYSQANDALNELRDCLRLCSHLWLHKNRFERGQRPNSRARDVIERCNTRIDIAVMKYHAARTALVVLGSRLFKVGWEQDLKPLDRQKDCRALEEDDPDDARRGDKGRRLNEGRRTRSWIWERPGMSVDSGDGLHDGKQSSCYNINIY